MGPQLVQIGSRITLNGNRIPLDQFSTSILTNSRLETNGDDATYSVEFGAFKVGPRGEDARSMTSSSVPLPKFKCSSAEVLNTLMFEIAQTIYPDDLKILSFRSFADKHTLESWPMSCFVEKAAYCEKLVITHLSTTEDNA